MLFKCLKKTFSTLETANFVPKHTAVTEEDVRLLQNFIEKSNRMMVLTGAGVSTESGIPDYRSEVVGLYARSNHKPMQYVEFLKSPGARQRYWARNYVGWERFSKCRPNVTHRCVADLETKGKVFRVVTQNVDGLHYKAGSKSVIELHGSAYRVVCLHCKKIYARDDVQKKLTELNPGMRETVDMIRPDGDVEISTEKIKSFTPPLCDDCRGILKPDIVFFGDNVPMSRVLAVKESVTESDSVLVLGSSLSVFSGYRIVLQAAEENKRIAIVNIGPTRADNTGALRINAKCGEILSKTLKST